MRKIALLVGVEEYRDQMISRLQFARADAMALSERLRSCCGFDQVRVLADKDGNDAPDLVNIITALGDAAAHENGDRKAEHEGDHGGYRRMPHRDQEVLEPGRREEVDIGKKRETGLHPELGALEHAPHICQGQGDQKKQQQEDHGQI